MFCGTTGVLRKKAFEKVFRQEEVRSAGADSWPDWAKFTQTILQAAGLFLINKLLGILCDLPYLLIPCTQCCGIGPILTSSGSGYRLPATGYRLPAPAPDIKIFVTQV